MSSESDTGSQLTELATQDTTVNDVSVSSSNDTEESSDHHAQAGNWQDPESGPNEDFMDLIRADFYDSLDRLSEEDRDILMKKFEEARTLEQHMALQSERSGRLRLASMSTETLKELVIRQHKEMKQAEGHFLRSFRITAFLVFSLSFVAWSVSTHDSESKMAFKDGCTDQCVEQMKDWLKGRYS